MDFPDTTGALLETFLQHFGSGLWCAQPPEFVQVVGPLHVAGKLLLGPFSCLPKLIIHELTLCFWMLWFAGWWWEDLVSNNLDSEFIFCFVLFVSGTEIWSFFLSADQDNGVEQFHGVGMWCGGRFFYSMQMWNAMGGTRLSSLELFRLVCVVLVNL